MADQTLLPEIDLILFQHMQPRHIKHHMSKCERSLGSEPCCQGRSTAIRIPTAVQNHGIVRQRSGLADRRPPPVGVGLQPLEQGRGLCGGLTNQTFKCPAQGADGVLAKVGLPPLLDGPYQVIICVQRLTTLQGQTGHLAPAGSRVWLDEHVVVLLEEAQRRRDRLLRYAREERQVSHP